MRIISCINDECFDIEYRVDGEKEGRFIATVEGREVELEIIERKGDSMTLAVDGRVGFYEFTKDKGRITGVVHANRTFHAEVKNPQQEQLEHLLAEMGAGGASAGEQHVAAPMPGKILAVRVKAGDKVEAGQVVLVLEAMKMENEIASSGEGTVRSVKCQTGANVNTGDVLIEIEGG
jgi:biotin carboxyl carrier protein